MTRPGRPKLAPTTDPGPLWVDATNWSGSIDIAELFGNDGPVELEFGCGRGMFLANSAVAKPGVNFIGLEVAKKVAQLAAFRCLNAGVCNVRVLAIDARKFLQLTPAASISTIHLYFPDPWWKRRHRKRRLVAPDVLTEMQRVLVAGGRVFLATDVEEYHRSMQQTFAGFPAFARDDDAGEPVDDNRLEYLTHFERKFRTAGKWIGRLAYNLTGRAAVRGNNSAEEDP